MALLRPIRPLAVVARFWRSVLAVVCWTFLGQALALKAATPSFGFDSLYLSYPSSGIRTTYEIPIKGVSKASDRAALRVTVTGDYPSIKASIDPIRAVLLFTPPVASWRDYTIEVFDERKPSAKATLRLSLSSSETIQPRSIHYRPGDGTPIFLSQSALTFYPDGTPKSETSICLPARPSDLALSSDGSLAYVLLADTRTVQIIDLSTLRTTSSVRLADFKTGGYDLTDEGRIALGQTGQIFTLDEAYPRTIRRQSLSTGKTLQTLAKAPDDHPWRDIATSPDRGTLWINSFSRSYPNTYGRLFRATLNAKGAALTIQSFDPETGPIAREDSYTPPRILQSGDGRLLAVDHRLYTLTSAGVLESRVELGQVALSFNSTAKILTLNRNRVLDLASAHEFGVTPPNSYSSVPPLVFFGNTYWTHPDWNLRLVDDYRAGVLRTHFHPGDARLVLPTDHLAWPAFPGAKSSLIQLRETARQSGELDPATRVLDQEVSTTEVALPATLHSGSTYAWRLAPRDFTSLAADDVATLGADFQGTFTVSDVVPDKTRFDIQSIEGLAAHDVALRLDTFTPETAWTLSSDQAWLQPQTVAHTGPADVILRIDATN
ncbi:MAG: hypothetical protein H7067_13455, partial [Burkholderiales bacterium]|nr:hypothetical protein [Opitutaceae bacterium]